METNILIESQARATELLLKGNKAAQAIPDNKARVYVIYDLLSKTQPNNKTLTVWAVKTSKSTYAGVLIKSGMKMKGCKKFANAVHISFNDIDIVCQKRRNNYLGAYLKLIEENGTLRIVKTIRVPFEDAAREILDSVYPETKGKKTILLQSKAQKNFSKKMIYWARKDGDVYKGLNIRSETQKIITAEDILKIFASGEKIDGNYVYIKGKRGAKIWVSKK